MASQETIKRAFDQKYAAWGIVIPADSFAGLGRGSITQNGWTINYHYSR